MASVPALQAFITKEVGGRFEVQTKALAVGTTVDKFVDHNYERLSMAIVNLSTSNVYVAPTSAVGATQGIVLAGTGASLTLTARDDLVLVGHEWYGVTTTAALLYIVEVVRFGATE